MPPSDNPSLVTLGRTLHGTPLLRNLAVGDVAESLYTQLGCLGANRAATPAEMQFHALGARWRDDRSDPESVGWTYVIAENAPNRAALEIAIAPLAVRRGISAWGGPLVYRDSPPSKWADWLNRAYFGMPRDGRPPPRYVLLLGSPEQIPFELQALLQTVAYVGRLDFDHVVDLYRYVEKALRLLDAKHAPVDRSSLIFAPDHNHPDPTYFSHRGMALPLRAQLESSLALPVTSLFAEDATKRQLTEQLASSRPALVYTASHGIGAPHGQPALQRRFNGAIYCQETSDAFIDNLFMAADIPLDRPFLDGGVFFQFACYGYGTPVLSSFAGWLPRAPMTGLAGQCRPFVSALPKRLLAHPRGPIAYIGHLDLALLLGSSDGAPPPAGAVHDRLAPFRTAVGRIVGELPVGYALEAMHVRHAFYGSVLIGHHDRRCRAELDLEPPPTPGEDQRFVQDWLIRSDAQNYMILGDPAVSVRLSAG